MSSENTVNSQIVDSVSAASTLLVAQGPAQSFSMLDMVMLETLGTAMHNAVARQQGAGMVSNAAVTATCAKMINAPGRCRRPLRNHLRRHRRRSFPCPVRCRRRLRLRQ